MSCRAREHSIWDSWKGMTFEEGSAFPKSKSGFGMRRWIQRHRPSIVVHQVYTGNLHRFVTCGTYPWDDFFPGVIYTAQSVDRADVYPVACINLAWCQFWLAAKLFFSTKPLSFPLKIATDRPEFIRRSPGTSGKEKTIRKNNWKGGRSRKQALPIYSLEG